MYLHLWIWKLFITLNPIHNVQDNLIVKKINFTPPYLNTENTLLQKDLHKIQGKKKNLVLW